MEVKPLQEIQNGVFEWSRRNFGDQPSHRPLLGLVEEVGELCHAHLKREQGIRTNEDHVLQQIDAIGDIMIYLLDYCGREGISLEAALEETWAEVSKRDWRNKKETGV